MNSLTDKNVNQFIDAINRDAIEECEIIAKQSEEFRKTEFERRKALIEEETRKDKEYYLNKILSEANKEISAAESEGKIIIAQKRTSVTEEIFSEAKNELIDFSKSEEYLPFLLKSAKKIIDALKTESITLFMKKEDAEYSRDIQNNFSSKINFEIDGTIIIGGLKGKSGDTLADDTLDIRLEEQKEWFKSDCGLLIQLSR